MPAQNISLDVTFHKKLAYFDGHFPELNILPGVALIKYTIEQLPEYLCKKSLKKIEKLKFTGIIRPDTKLTLKLIISETQDRVDFCWKSNHKTYAVGRLLY